MEIPCKDCILIPVCRRKLFKNLMDQCSILKLYLYRKMHPPLGYYTSFPRRNHPHLYLRHVEVIKFLRPKEWYVYNITDSNKDETVIVISKDEVGWEDGHAGTVQHSMSAIHAQLEHERKYATESV